MTNNTLIRDVIIIIYLSPFLCPNQAESQPSWTRLIANRACERIVITDKHIVVTTQKDNTLSSSNGGITWSTIATNGYEVYYYDEDAQGTQYIEIKGGGIHKTSNNGNTWERILGLDILDQFQFGQERLRMLPDGALICATENADSDTGIMYSTNKGETWLDKSGNINSSFCELFGVMPDSSIILQRSSNVFYKAKAGNIIWEKADMSFEYNTYFNYVSCAKDGYMIAVGIATHCSEDSGRTWKLMRRNGGQFHVNNRNRAMFDSSNNAYVFDWSDSEKRIWKYQHSTDQWMDISYNLPKNINNQIINDIAATRSGVVYAATDSGLYRLDYGTSCTNESEYSNTDLFDIYPNPANNIIKIQCKNNTRHPIEMRIYDIYGNIAININKSMMYMKEYTVPVKTLPRGIYILYIDEREVGKQTKLLLLN